jgi:flavin reductase (DIM6/NTAB) family NADH-FMN oxidoreductase RutF
MRGAVKIEEQVRMSRYVKKDFLAHNVRRFLEPGPIVLVSSAHKGRTNIMTMGWHMVMEFSPSLVGAANLGPYRGIAAQEARWAVITIRTRSAAFLAPNFFMILAR